MGGSCGLLETLKRGNVPGPDGVLNEMLIYRGSRLVESIASMFKECQVYPNEKKRGFVVLLVKSGDPVIARNYRGIALQSCVAKVRARISTARLGRVGRREHIDRSTREDSGKCRGVPTRL